jgi:hypothetical protein
MDEDKLRRLEMAGWQSLTVEELLDLSNEEALEIERRLRIQENDPVS